MVFITSVLATLITIALFGICLLVALLTAERKRNAELKRLDDKIDRLADREMTSTERAVRSTRQRRANARHRRALDVYQD